MTGNLLRWDEDGYWQTVIEATIVSNMPAVGQLGKASPRNPMVRMDQRS